MERPFPNQAAGKVVIDRVEIKYFLEIRGNSAFYNVYMCSICGSGYRSTKRKKKRNEHEHFFIINYFPVCLQPLS